MCHKALPCDWLEPYDVPVARLSSRNVFYCPSASDVSGQGRQNAIIFNLLIEIHEIRGQKASSGAYITAKPPSLDLLLQEVHLRASHAHAAVPSASTNFTPGTDPLAAKRVVGAALAAKEAWAKRTISCGWIGASRST